MTPKAPGSRGGGVQRPRRRVSAHHDEPTAGTQDQAVPVDAIALPRAEFGVDATPVREAPAWEHPSERPRRGTSRRLRLPPRQ